MSIETRSSSALFKRAEQLKRWEESETNREASVPSRRSKKIQFSAGCVFLAACAAGDKEEVLRLLQKGADIDTSNVDGLTALHQACIDDNLDMVEFLVENGADVNRGDNEGWTPLHATASCGFISIAKYLIENCANVAAVNNDAELPVDIAESDEMEFMLQQNIDSKGIDCDEARNEEERMMLADAKEWLNAGEVKDHPHPKTGARALHVASAKGYIKVMSVLLQGGADVNCQDFDGWTPLHAAAHWGQKEACELLAENFCDMEMRNLVGQTAFDIADPELVSWLEELQKKQAEMEREQGAESAILQKKSGNGQKRRSSVTRMSVVDKSNLINKDTSAERQLLDRSISEESSNKIKTVEVEIEGESDKEEASEVEKRNRVNRDDSRIPSTIEVNNTSVSPLKTTEIDDSSYWRRPGSLRNRGPNGSEERSNKTVSLRIVDKDNLLPKTTTPTGHTSRTILDTPEVVLRRTQSFEADEKFYRKYLELQARIKAGSCPTLHSPNVPTRSASLREKHLLRQSVKNEESTSNSPSIQENEIPASLNTATTTVPSANTSPSRNTSSVPTSTSPLPTSQVRSPSDSVVTNCPQSPPTTPTTPGGTKISPGNIFKNFFKSFVPPVRDEESETQRKAHAKRVRETRRSTQGVTLEEIKSAEQFVKKKNQQQLQQATQQLNNSDQPPVVTNSTSISATITTATPTVISTGKEEEVMHERRPSWRLRVDNGDRNKFLLEDARSRSSVNETAVPTTYIRRPPSNISTRPSSAPVETAPDTTVTIALRRPAKPPDDKDQDKENDIRNAQATQGVIQRRRRPKRRSTGVVHYDIDDTDPDRHESPGRGEEGESSKINNEEYFGHAVPPLQSLFGRSVGAICVSACLVPPQFSADVTVEHMATYRSNQSSSSVMSVPHRNRSSKAGVKSSNRPRSLGLYPSTTSRSVFGSNGIYSASLFLGNSPANSGSYLISSSGSCNLGKPAKSFSSYLTSGNKYGSIPSKYSTGINSSNFSTYGGTTTGYGGLNLSSSALNLSSSALNLSPSSSSFYNYNPGGLNSFRSASLMRSNSSRVSPILRNSSGLSARSRSSSLTSLASSTLSGSEGYSSGPDSSRLSASPVGDTVGNIRHTTSVRSKESSENGEVDYKLLYEATVVENERLREKLQKTEDALSDTKSQVDKSSVFTTKNSLTEIEKRERRAMERKLSEMEEELKLLEQYKSENQKLKDENGALIRVISKLSK